MSTPQTQTPGVRSFLDCSTGHLDRPDACWLLHDLEAMPPAARAALEGVADAHAPFMQRHTYGARILVDDHDAVIRWATACCATLAPVLTYAKAHGCWEINFDRDADHLPGIATYSW